VDLGLRGKTALITGASRGLGRGIALALGQEGTNVVLCARGAEALAAAEAEVAALGVETHAVALDLSAPGAAERLVDAAVERFGRLDVLVNNVGANRRKPFAETTEEDWAAIVEMNLQVHVRVTRAALPVMRRQRSGAIVFVASIFGREAGGPGLVLYNTTKSALISLAKILSLEVAADGIRVVSVAPGSLLFPGGSWHRRQQEDPEGIAVFVRRNIPLGRFGRVEEVADVVAFLASDRASLITGTCLNIDGGQSRSLV